MSWRDLCVRGLGGEEGLMGCLMRGLAHCRSLLACQPCCFY
jgi:hypothetical protein